MAVITKIGGVATSGTSGVNNIFGSGTTGGASSPSTTPTIVLGSANVFAGNQLMVANSTSYTNPLFNLKVTHSNGTEYINSQEDYAVAVAGGFYILAWDASTAPVGTYTVSLSIVDADASPEEIESAVATATYTKSSTNFKYIRFYGLDSNGDRGLNHTQTSLIVDMQLFTDVNNTGTQMTGINNGTYNTSNTSNPNFELSAGQEFNGYSAWEAFDNGALNTASAWWSLGRNNSAENYLELKYLNQTENASSAYATDADLPSTKSVRLYHTTNGNCDQLAVFASMTGAFAGEETQIGTTLSKGSSGYKSFSL